MTVRDSDVEYDFDDPDEGWFGMAEPTEPTEPAPIPEPEHHEDVADTDRWFVQDMDLAAPVESVEPPIGDRRVTESVAASLNVVPSRRSGFVRASAPTSWESRLSNSGAWDFKPTSTDSRFPARAVVIAVGVIVGVAAVLGVFLTMRGPAPAAEESPPAPPSQSAAPSAPMTSAPAP
ncbi:hypothetical protein, partial [Mycolicibacterium sp.]|uniref:hypothetical protein n=1 Tax=Mycolicibacterium sp. TaxID=2320850 RepID=UPI001A303A38